MGGRWCAVTPGVREDIWYRCGSCIERFVDDRIVPTLRGPGCWPLGLSVPPLGASSVSMPPGSLSSFLGEVPVQRRPALPEVLGDVFASVAVGLHPLRGGDVLGVVDLAGPSELRAVRP